MVSTRLTSLDSDCTAFSAPVRVPDEALGDKAKVTLSFADWKDGGVAPRMFEVPIVEPKPVGKPE